MDGILNLIFEIVAIGGGKSLLIAYLCILLEVPIDIFAKEILND